MSAKQNDGGPAFPYEGMTHVTRPDGVGTLATVTSSGMSLRDYFAAQVNVAPYTPFTTLSDTLGRKPTVQEMADWIAAVRFTEADAMLEAKGQPT